MKNSIYIFLSVIGLGCCLSACQNLDDFDPVNVLPAEDAVTDERSVELLLNGIYGRLLTGEPNSGSPEFYAIPSLLSGIAATGFFGRTTEEAGYDINQPVVGGTTVNRGGFGRLYSIINNCNWLLQEIEKLQDSDFENPERRSEIIGEAKAVRATAHFYLLRLWGQFYDLDSPFGITIRTTPALSDDADPRNTVMESYTAIISDLDDAIADAPDLRAKTFANKTYAMALKAKVFLYQGNYDEAASLAREVLDNSGTDFMLSPTYGELFDNTSATIFDASEHLFALQATQPDEELAMGDAWGLFARLTPEFIVLAETGTMTVGTQVIAYDNGRVQSQLSDFTNEILKYPTFLEPSDIHEMLYHLRMAEMHLIFAEADARANNAVTPEALAALNAVRIRAGATTTGGDGFETYPATIALNQFLEAVRLEKLMELYAEMGEEWFDLVRYDHADGFGAGFQVSDIKPTATNPDRFILPIAGESVDASDGVVVQNPGY